MADSTDVMTLVRYKSWADEIFYHALSSVPESELERNRLMLFDNILSLLHHVYAMDVVWKSHLEGVPHNFKSRNPASSASFDDLRHSQYCVNNWFEEYVADIDTVKYQEEINITFIGGGTGKMRRVEVIQHIVNHASYHRGHVEGVLYQLSIEPPTTDMPVFLRHYSAHSCRA